LDTTQVLQSRWQWLK